MRIAPCWSAALLALSIGLTPALARAASSAGAPAAYPGYMALDPPLVVNLMNPKKSRYLKVDIQFFIETQAEAEVVSHHMPRLRDRLISQLGGRDGDTLMTTEAREQLRAELLESLRETLKEQTGTAAIGALYFTGFIVQ